MHWPLSVYYNASLALSDYTSSQATLEQTLIQLP